MSPYRVTGQAFQAFKYEGKVYEVGDVVPNLPDEVYETFQNGLEPVEDEEDLVEEPEASPEPSEPGETEDTSEQAAEPEQAPSGYDDPLTVLDGVGEVRANNITEATGAESAGELAGLDPDVHPDYVEYVEVARKHVYGTP